MFSVQNYGSLADTHTGLPLAELFWQATSTRGGAFGLVFMVWIALGPCVIGSQLSEYWLSGIEDDIFSDFDRYWTRILGLRAR